MRKTIFMLAALLAAGSCIRENTDDCPACMSLAFELDDPYSPGNFDSDIGNDVELQFFREDRFSGRVILPYEAIRGGQSYRFRKQCSDRLKIVAYALPAGQRATIPSPESGASYYAQSVRMESAARASGYAPYGGALYLGRVSIGGNVRRYVVAMVPCFAKVMVVVADAEGLRTPVVGLEGTAGVMQVPDKRTFGDIEVRAGLSGENDVYTTGWMHILPPETSGRNLRVNLYDDGAPVLYVQTDQQAVAGKEIVIKIERGNLTAEITIDGWTYKTQVVIP